MWYVTVVRRAPWALIFMTRSPLGKCVGDRAEVVQLVECLPRRHKALGFNSLYFQTTANKQNDGKGLSTIWMGQWVSSEFSVTITECPRRSSLKRERFVLDHSFRDIKPMADWLIPLGPVIR